MKVLYITGVCLTKNTSANMSHNAYIKGLIANGAEVDIVMANDSWGKEDPILTKFQQATYYEYNSISIRDRILSFYKNRRHQLQNKDSSKQLQASINNRRYRIRVLIKKITKIVIDIALKQDKLYPLQSTWIKNASKFSSAKTYDLVISNSSPSASHKLVTILRSKGRIKYTKWAQIWEDPWYYDYLQLFKIII